MSVVTETALRQLAPAVVVPPGCWNPHMPTHTPLKIPVGVPEGDGADCQRLPLQCDAAISVAAGLYHASAGEDWQCQRTGTVPWPALDKEPRS
ncbi:Uncharacterised protein [Pandoraea pulmonicola]|uniref:Uncharacterized protein n=1 Tax=Pandoraea pulmonicola TaxID=93221 RepID=A0AAJ5D345_PANPU|nr:Uncharacterised protein [Pandoraea pulmonicola]